MTENGLYALSKALVLPPGIFVLLLVLALILWRPAPRFSIVLVVFSTLSLYLLSTTFVAGHLILAAENDPSPASSASLRPPQAIVVLGAGIDPHPRPSGGPTVDALGLERARTAAGLHRATGLPVAVSGGSPAGSGVTVGAAMRDSLEKDFLVPVRWLESGSGNTRENARESKRILAADKVSGIYLVTHAWHMPRARRAFEQAGFEVTPAPVPGTVRPHLEANRFVPQMNNLAQSYYALHEIVGSLWYRMTEDGPRP